MTGKEKKLTGWFFNLIGVFNHYTFFTDELWRNVKGFKNNHVESVRVSVGSYGGENVLDAIKDVLDEIEIDFGVGVNTRLVEF